MQITPERKTGIIIFDLDGCVSDDAWRLDLIPEGANCDEDYHAYHLKMGEDIPLPEGRRRLLQAFEQRVLIAFVTARPITYAAETLTWIGNCFSFLSFPVDFVLHMRPANHPISSPDFKRGVALDLLKLAASNRTSVIGAFDDRQDVLYAYESVGIPGYILDKNGTDAPLVQIFVPASEPGEPTSPVALPMVKEQALPVAPVEPDTFEYEAEVVSEPVPRKPTADIILFQAAQTFAERNAQYKDNAVLVGEVMLKLFPNGVVIKTEADHHFYHLFELMIVKLTRFANSGLKHVDSLHDLMVYAAMCETTIEAHSIQVLEQ